MSDRLKMSQLMVHFTTHSANLIVNWNCASQTSQVFVFILKLTLSV